MEDQNVVSGVVFQPVRVVVEPGLGLDLDELLPSGSSELVILGEAGVASRVKVPVANDGLVGVPDQQDGRVVDLSEVIEPQLLVSWCLGAISCCMAMGLDCHHQSSI